jgi:crotonobetainyl-CoA:carnitine CoA-transferase CaiB-like acyl-CoA transferase
MGARALGSNREPQEWIRATREARESRAVVAGQLADLLVAEDITGGRELVTQRLRDLAGAERTGDPLMVRAALMTLAVACGAYCVRLDLQQDHPGAFRSVRS